MKFRLLEILLAENDSAGEQEDEAGVTPGSGVWHLTWGETTTLSAAAGKSSLGTFLSLMSSESLRESFGAHRQ